MTLTDKEICEIALNCRAIEGDNFPPVIYARAIEAAILKKLSEQEPCCYGNQTALDNMLDDRVAEVAGMRDGWRKTPLYLHPAPPPEGYQLVLIEPTEAMVAAGQEIAHELITANCCKNMNGLGGGKTWQEFKDTCKNLELCEMYLNNDIDSVEAIYRAMLAAAKEMK